MAAAPPIRTQSLGDDPPGIRLLWAANAVLSLAPDLRATGFIDDLPRLRRKLQATLADFQARARAGGVTAARVTHATEVLAALLDNVVTSMPWGVDADWQSLSSNSADRTPAQRLLAVLATPPDAGMRELLRVALALGFDRRAGTADDPLLDRVRARLAEHRVRAPDATPPATPRRSAWRSWLPLWVSGLLAAALLAALFVRLDVSLGAKSDRVFARLAALARPRPAATPAAPVPPRLSAALAAQIAARTLAVHDDIDRSVVVLPTARLFEEGDAVLLTPGADALRALAAVLRDVAGRIHVIGHSDASLPRSAQYPSDWDLSVERARRVRDALHDFGIDSRRLGFDGRGAVEPLRADDPARALGGDARIEVIVVVGR